MKKKDSPNLARCYTQNQYINTPMARDGTANKLRDYKIWRLDDEQPNQGITIVSVYLSVVWPVAFLGYAIIGAELSRDGIPRPITSVKHSNNHVSDSV